MTTIISDAARVVLFGRSRSGKSALLAALAELSQHGGELALLGEAAAGAGPIVAHRAVWRPAGGAPLDAVLLDCEGLAASELLARVAELEEDDPELPLAREVLAADALVLTVDASAPPAELSADFAAFKTFLRTLEERRGQDVEVGGLPIYLVLTHADLLARPLDSPAEWVEQLEGRKREVDDAFRAYLAGDEPPVADEANPDDIYPAEGGVDLREEHVDPAEPEGEEVEPEEEAGRESGFGWVDVHVWATALKRPPLRGQQAASAGPFGVAELFRQALADAAEFRESQRRSHRRLRRLVGLSALLVALLLGVTAVQVVTAGRGPPADLVARVESYRFRDGEAPQQYLRGTVGELRERLGVLREVRDDPRFGQLPPETQAFVTGRLDELGEYIALYDRLLSSRSPYEELSTDDLEKLRARLTEGDLAPPAARRWVGTPAGLLRDDRLQATAALLAGAEKLKEWYDARSAEAEALWTFANDALEGTAVAWGTWGDKVRRVLSPEHRAPPEAPAEALPGAPEGLTYADAMRLFEVKDARFAWEMERDRLSGLLDVAAALGLVRDVPGRPPVLVIPDNFTLADVPKKLAALREAYPTAARTFGTQLPEGVSGAQAIAEAARREYARLLPVGRARVLRRYLAEKGDAAARWRGVRAWLQATNELEAFNELALLYQRLFEVRPEAPVPALVKFLGEESFTLTVETMVVEVRAFSGIEPERKAPLRLTVSVDGKPVVVELAPAGGGRDDPKRKRTLYTYQARRQSLAYAPGAELSLELPLEGRKGEGRARLVWADSRTTRYQFEKLLNPPRRQVNGGKPESRELRDVSLSFQPADGVPRVPDLLPEVR